MGWEFTDDVQAHLRAVGGLLAEDPVEHTLPLTVVETARRGARPPRTTWGAWGGDGAATGAVSWTPPYGLLLAAVPDDAVRPLVDVVAGWSEQPDSLSGPTGAVVQVAAAWAARTGGTAVLHHAERLHRLVELSPLRPVPAGRARVAVAAEAPLLQSWLVAFAAEAGLPAGNVAALVDDRMTYGGLLLWEEAGRPVSLAAASRPAEGVVRIGPVYTPPGDRCHGYAAGVTEHACRQALTSGATDVVLFTNLGNPTSNALYRRLGFRPLSDRLVVRLEPPS